MRVLDVARKVAVGALLVVILVVVSAFPIYWMVVSSLSKSSQFSWPPHLLPHDVGLDSYVQALRNWPMLRWTVNTVFITVGATVLSLLVSIPAGLSVSRFRTRINRAFGGFVLVTQMIPATLLVVPRARQAGFTARDGNRHPTRRRLQREGRAAPTHARSDH